VVRFGASLEPGSNGILTNEFFWLMLLLLSSYTIKIMETKRRQMAGGVNQGIDNPTWLKQPGDRTAIAIALVLCSTGMVQLVTCYYRLATGTGKRET
jgi:hypothetical protein